MRVRIGALFVMLPVVNPISDRADNLGPYEMSGYVNPRAVAIDSSLISFMHGRLGLLHDRASAWQMDLSGR